eukprot:gene2495-3087_t
MLLSKSLILALLIASCMLIVNATNDLRFHPWTDLGADPDLTRNISQLIQARGYPEEDHTATTPDGYILSLQRIPAGRYQNNPNPYGPNGRPVVLLQHGVEDIGTTWVMQENVYQSLGFILADAGFDVWINNVRGTTYSNSNTHLDPNLQPFWQFSFDEMAQYDVPTAINYILNVTGKDDLGYVGHSQGTTIAFIAFMDPVLASKINLFVALAPVVQVTHCKSEFLLALADFNIDVLFEIIGDKSFLASTPFLNKILPYLCKNEPSICQNSLALIMGWDTQNINNTRLPVYAAHEPGGTSVQNVVHWAQATKHSFQKFDFGPIGNLKKYGQITPPKYDISKFNAPTIIFYGGNDYLADTTDVQWLIPQLGSKLLWNKFIESYSHLDFVWGMDAYTQVYAEATQYLLQYATK